MSRDRGPIEVTVQVDGRELAAGTLWVHERHGQNAVFRYHESYLANGAAYSLDPALPLVAGVIQTPVGKEMFNAFSDSAPDRWGQGLLRRRERDRSAADGAAPRVLRQVDFLLGVRDDLRQGATRFRDPSSGAYWSPAEHGVPVLVSLGKLLRESDRLTEGDPGTSAISDLVEAGSSLGGARPKAAVVAHGRLALAKFPRPGTDQWDVPLWEAVEAELARRAGLDVAKHQLVKVRGRNVLLSYRFDRTPLGERVGFTSALTMLEASDHDRRSYLEIAEVIERHSPHARRDLAELYRRIVFSAFTANSDDHLRNHGFLREANGWQLAPAYDMNPAPDNPGHLSTLIDLDDSRTDMDLVLSVAPYFRLSDTQAKQEVMSVGHATSEWQSLAGRLGAPKTEIAQMHAAYETELRSQVRRLMARPPVPPPGHRLTTGGQKAATRQPNQPGITPVDGQQRAAPELEDPSSWTAGINKDVPPMPEM